MIPMVDELFEQLGDYVSGCDIYAREDASAWFGDGPSPGEWTEEPIGSDHDSATLGGTPDTPDWWAYSLKFWDDSGVQKWRVANHSGTTEAAPWYLGGGSKEVEQGVPMSGEMDWTALSMYAAETDIGAYLSPIDPLTHPEIPGGAATKGGGGACWDMDWSWGSEVVPLQFAGFAVQVTDLGSNNYRVTLTPAAPTAVSMTAAFTESIGISVTPTSVDFGNLVPGAASAAHVVTVTNTGNIAEDFSASIENESPASVYTGSPGLQMNTASVGSWTPTDVAVDDTEVPSLVLTVPADTAPGTYEATLVFWAAAH